MDQPPKSRGLLHTIARVLLGLVFVVLGLNGFLLFIPPPPPGMMPAIVNQWNGAMFTSHYMWMTSGFQVLAGVLLLLNRYVLVALIILAGLLVNILTFHITMWPQTLFPLPVLTFVLWLVVCWPLRDRFAPLFTPKV